MLKFDREPSYYLDMNTTTTQTTKLPVRLSWLYGSRATVIAGTPGSAGDAGWTIVEVTDVRGFIACNPSAAMPCWRRFGPGGDL